MCLTYRVDFDLDRGARCCGCGHRFRASLPEEVCMFRGAAAEFTHRPRKEDEKKEKDKKKEKESKGRGTVTKYSLLDAVYISRLPHLIGRLSMACVLRLGRWSSACACKAMRSACSLGLWTSGPPRRPGGYVLDSVVCVPSILGLRTNHLHGSRPRI